MLAEQARHGRARRRRIAQRAQRDGARSREVYLPKGRWEDFWDRSRVYTGPTTITVDAPLDLIPVFVRAGAKVEGRP